ncbi:MAG: hypothetical protein MI924_32365 [Chloroflexales bacterium]|nr:hypothetical protein [Chloroflexales bacterium]
MDHERFADLQRIPNRIPPVYISLKFMSTEAATMKTVERYLAAYRLFADLFGSEPSTGLVILSAADWQRYAALPIAGVTHYDHKHRAVIAPGELSAFWHEAVEMIGRGSPDLMVKLSAVYGQSDGTIDLTSHIDLWVTHDLGHAFHSHHEYFFPRRWLMEYFADLCSYVATAQYEPNQLPALETFPIIMSELDNRQFAYQSWSDFEEQYGKPSFSVENYLWYHGFLYAVAKEAYRRASIAALHDLWTAFVPIQRTVSSDADLLLIFQQVQPELARLLQTRSI